MVLADFKYLSSLLLSLFLSCFNHPVTFWLHFGKQPPGIGVSYHLLWAELCPLEGQGSIRGLEQTTQDDQFVGLPKACHFGMWFISD